MNMVNMIHLFSIVVWGCTGFTCWSYVQHTVNTIRGYCYSPFGPERIVYIGNKDVLCKLRSWAALWLLTSLAMLAVVMYGPGAV